MAYKRNFRNYGRRAYSGARNRFNSGRRYYKNNYQGQSVKVRVGNAWLLGAALGFTNMDNPVPSEVKLGVATMPVGGKIGGKLKAASQGAVFGNLVQHMIGFRTGDSSGNDGTL